ncbi:ATP-binding protein [Kitasatospora aburaviensis]
MPGTPAMLYGREREQAVVEALLDGARSGRSGVLVVRGEPGIGKTALLEHAVAAAGGGFRVIRATGVEYEAELPFAGLSLLLAPGLDRLSALPGPQQRPGRGVRARRGAGRCGDARRPTARRARHARAVGRTRR